MIPYPWMRIDKGDTRARMLADGHYTRQSVGAPMWTRPGFNFCLFAETEPWWGCGSKAVWCWWRPAWEQGIERGDGLRALECTIFRLIGRAWTASDLITAAVSALDSIQATQELAISDPPSLPLITGVDTAKTAKRRGKHNLAGHCFREAGWSEFPHRSGRADVWLAANHA